MGDQQVTVRFVTKDAFEKYRIGDSPLAIPRKLGRYGLSEVINHLLGLENSPQPFDFSINDQLIREPLSSFISSHNMSVEDVITIEYMPAYSLGDERSTVQADAWVGSLDVFDASQILVAGCYDGSLQISSCTLESKSAEKKQSNENKVLAHEDPIRDVTSWSGGSIASALVATASKDQSVKLWKVKSADGGKEAKGKKRDLSGAERNNQYYHIEQMALLEGHTSSVEALAYYSDSNANKSILFSGDWAGNIFAWDVSENNAALGGNTDKNNGPVPTIANMNVNRAHNQAIQGLQLSDTSGSWRMYSCAMDHSLKEWDVERQDCISTFTSDSKIFTSMHFSESSRIIGSSHNDGRVRLWDMRKSTAENTCLKITNGPSTQWVSSFRWHPSSSTAYIFATTDYAGVVRLWDIRATTSPLDTITSHDGKALCAAWNPTADRDAVHSVYTGGSDCNINRFTFGVI